jgi:AraC-like DNA-binding protein
MKNIVNHGARNGPDWCYWRTPGALLSRYAPEPLVSGFLVSRSGYFPKCWHNAAWRRNLLHETVFTLCLDGQGWVRDINTPDAPRIPIVPGEVLVLPPNVPHSYGADDHDPWTQLWFHAIGPRVAQFLGQLGVKDAPHKGRLTRLGTVKDSVFRMNELRRQGCGRNVLLESAALGELVFARLYAEACLEPVGRRVWSGTEKEAAVRARKLEQVTAFFQANFRRELSLAEVAQACHVSESWLYHSFSEHSGFSPLAFVIRLRLHEACRTLATTDRKLDDIAASVGYDDPFYFSRLFKKHIGLAPSAYRREYHR